MLHADLTLHWCFSHRGSCIVAMYGTGQPPVPKADLLASQLKSKPYDCLRPNPCVMLTLSHSFAR